MSGFKYSLTLSNVPFTNECGLSKTWNTGGADPITRHLVTRMAAPVIARNRWRTHRLLNQSPDVFWKNIYYVCYVITLLQNMFLQLSYLLSNIFWNSFSWEVLVHVHVPIQQSGNRSVKKYNILKFILKWFG